MSIKQTNDNHARRVARRLAAQQNQGQTSTSSGIWQWINGIVNGFGHFMGQPLDNSILGLSNAVNTIVNVIRDIKDTLHAVWLTFQWIWHHIYKLLNDLRSWVVAKVQAQVKMLLRIIFITTQYVLATCMRAIKVERNDRVKAVARAERKARLAVRALHHTIEHEAVSGYSQESHNRVSLIIRLLEFAVTRVPAIKTIVGDLTTGLLDLLTIDDPIARITLGFLIKHVIDRLGIDKAVGRLIDDLLAPFLGKPMPRNLHDVMLDISQRLDAVESQWAQFMQDGGSQVEQAGTDWKHITSIVGNLAIVAFTVQAVIDPEQWATEVADTIGVAANDTLTKAAKLFKG